ncbi:MAG: DUF2520 domain-containing protein [Bacteroidia bacterium]
MEWGIIGAGGVGQAIAQRLCEKGISVGLLHRPYQHVQVPCWCTTDLEAFLQKKWEGIFLCVKDYQIPILAHTLQEKGFSGKILHTAGSVGWEVISPWQDQAGVIYPLQTFSVGDKIDWEEVYVFWEGAAWVESMARLLSEKVYYASGQERLGLHIGAVFAANFTNALLHIAAELSPWGHAVYLPLLGRVVSKLGTRTPAQAQTGPAIRKDLPTLQKHQAYLRAHHPEVEALYKQITRYIQEKISAQSGQ